MKESTSLTQQLRDGDRKALARCISTVENESEGWMDLLQSLDVAAVPVIGITGPPGAGKSTLISNLVQHYSREGKKIGVLAVDPSSPFHHGSLLGDRLRMNLHFSNPDVYIRSVATRGSLGGLTDKAMEITDVMKAAGFDLIIIETVGIGQSETEIASLADVTVLVLVPESGDEIQTLKAGVMEIEDIYVVNKADHADAEKFAESVSWMANMKPREGWTAPVVKCVATQDIGTKELVENIGAFLSSQAVNSKRILLFVEKAYRLIAKERMKDINKDALAEQLRQKLNDKKFNLYRFVKAMEDHRGL
jgi:LAO/AO transport system kinase